MPTVKRNISVWGRNSSWKRGGDEWSEPWGGPEAQWLNTILPRIQPFIPAESILEIAPGFGRWTRFLAKSCKRLIAIDLNRNCIEACKSQFADSPHVQFYVNDGRSLDAVPDESIDFIFSFDSLVHVDRDVMEAYLSQFPRILKRDAAAFIHHSNCGEYAKGPLVRAMLRVPLVRRYMHEHSLFGVRRIGGLRSENVSAATVRSLCRRHGLRCTSQELVTWCEDFLNDCFSIVVRADSGLGSQETILVENYSFMEEAARAKARSG
jgi:ubiquinone/menaquinone biosynthesis C-methylase UbiE